MATSGTLGAVGVLSVYANDSRKDEEKTLTDIQACRRSSEKIQKYEL